MALGPIYFAYVDPDQTTFDPSTMLRMDETIFALDIKHDEGQVAIASVTMKNPYVGLLSPDRKKWCWIAFTDQSGNVTPIFFGALVGIPTGLFAEIIKVEFHARPSDYIAAKQTCAETLKTYENYDPIWLQEGDRDNPDKILEGWSALYHVDRVTHAVTASDVLVGEDGTITFTEDQALYDGMEMTMGEAPLNTVQIQANVKFNQRCIGYIPGPTVALNTYTGQSFMKQWPKAGASLGGGWFCESSYVTDYFNTTHGFTKTFTLTIFGAPGGHDCTLAQSTGTSTQVVSGPSKSVWSITDTAQAGYCNPGNFFDGVSIPVPGMTAASAFFEELQVWDAITVGKSVNIPAKYSAHGISVLLWQLLCTWTLRYEANRDYTELCTITINADLQNTVVSPTIDESTKVIKITGADVGLPLENPSAWTDFAGQYVTVGQVCYGNDPTVVGANAYQICTVPGIAGTSEPTFSPIFGTATIDNQVTWMSIGDSPPPEPSQWNNSANIAAGTIVYVTPKQFVPNSGAMENIGTSYFLLAMNNGTTNNRYAEFMYVKPPPDSDYVVLTRINSGLYPTAVGTTFTPTTAAAQMVVPTPWAGILGPGDIADSNYDDPYTGQQSFGSAIDPTVGATFTDGSVTWMQLGTNPPFMGIPLGGSMSSMTARFFFPSSRGAQSIIYLINKGRAVLRYRARCIKVVFVAPVQYCLGLSCRKNATLYDSRIPGGVATGKVTSYTLSWTEDGQMIGKVQIGVCVGKGGSISQITGVPEYTAATGYCLPGYQAYDGGTYVLAEEDISYPTLTAVPYDDGLAFPLQQYPGTVALSDIQLTDQILAIAASVKAQQNQVQEVLVNIGTTTSSQGDILEVSLTGDSGVGLPSRTLVIEYVPPKTVEFLIPPVTNGPFNGSFVINTSVLTLPEGVNLSYSGPSP